MILRGDWAIWQERQGGSSMIEDREAFEQARQQAVELLRNINCENVVRSVLLVLGDYGVTESESREEAEERGKYIAGINYCAVSAIKMNSLTEILAFAKAVIKFEQEEAGKVV